MGQIIGAGVARCSNEVELDVEFDEDDAVVVVNGDRKELEGGKALCTIDGTLSRFDFFF